MKVKLLNSGGYFGIYQAKNFNYEYIFEAVQDEEFPTGVLIRISELLKGGYDLEKGYGNQQIPDDVEDLFLTFWLDEREAVIVEE